LGYLADIGRSNAFQVGQGIFKDVLASGAQEHQGLLDAAQLKNRQDMIDIARQDEARKQEEHKYQTRTLLGSDIIGKGDQSGMPNTAKFSVDLAKQLGLGNKIVNPDGTVDYSFRADEFKKAMSDHYKDKMNEFHFAELQDAKLNVGNLQAAKDKEKDPNKQAQIGEQLQQAQSRYSAVREAYAGSHGKFDLGSKLGGPKFQSDSGEIFYQSANGLVDTQGTQYDPQANGNLKSIVDPATKEPSNDFQTFVAGQKEGNPNITNDQISKNWHKQKMDEAIAAAKVRGEGFAASRPVQVLDTKQGNSPAIMSLADVSGANALEPGRYIPMGAQKALGQTALIEDIRGAIVNTRTSLKNLKTDFTASQAAQIALIMKQRDPRSATSAFIGSRIGETLTPEQVDYVTDLAQLIENGMAMRSVLGAGQGSDELRSAIMNTIPSAKTPNRAYANTQLDKFEQQINRLERGVPKVNLRSDTGKTQTGSGPSITETRTLKDGTTWNKLSDGTFQQVK